MAGSIDYWSTTAATNANADPTINWAEGMLPGIVNDSGRAEMAVQACYYKDTNGSLTTGGSANAYTVTMNATPAALATGLKLRLKINASNTGASTLVVTPNGASAFASKAIRVIAPGGERDPLANELRVNGIYEFGYDAAANSAAGAWMLLNPSSDTAAGVASRFSPSNPTGTTSTSFVMMGLGSTCTLTPVISTRALITISGNLQNSAGNGAAAQLAYGTGAAPTNGAAAIGTTVGISSYNPIPTSGVAVPFGQTAVITGLTVGTAYWIDCQVEAITGGTASITSLTVSVCEV